MNFRSVADLARVIRENAHRIPRDIDLVVGIPRSGLLAANLIALTLNLKVTDLYGWVRNAPLPPANTRAIKHEHLELPYQARHVLLVDDSVYSGRSMAEAYKFIESLPTAPRVTCCAVFATKESRQYVDLAFELVPMPRVFEWNVMHREFLSECCVDIDGVLCIDPTPEQNDDGDRYFNFLTQTQPRFLPTCPIGHLVTSRLEKYRAATVAWLHHHGIKYVHLHMLDLPNGQTRRALNAHANFKAKIYRQTYQASLFIESERHQAIEIAQLSGKPVLCFSSQELFQPGVSLALLEHKGRKFAYRLARYIYRSAKRVIKV